MGLKILASFRRKFAGPCGNTVLQLFRFRFRKPKALQFRRRKPVVKKKTVASDQAGCFSRLIPFPCSSLKRGRNKGRIMELGSVSDVGPSRKDPCPSPLTPAYVRMSQAAPARDEESAGEEDDDVRDSCRSFENYLAAMIVEKGDVRDLADVEELLRSWNSLNCPVFMGLVSRFYGELCKDLFSDSSRSSSYKAV